MYKLSPSILAADFAKLGEEVQSVDRAGVQYMHIDVMDGLFVPSISFGMPIIASIRPYTKKVFDVHLMIERPERYIDEFAAVGADIITIHVEACACIPETLLKIKNKGIQAGISLNPKTDISAIVPYLEMVDQVLVMSVEPGFGGQTYIEGSERKIAELHAIIFEKQLEVSIAVDGGINKENVGTVLEAGANVIVAGSAVYRGNVEENVTYFLDKFKEYEKAKRRKDTK